MKFISLAGLAAAAALAAFSVAHAEEAKAENSGTETAAAPAKPKKDSSRLICKVDNPTGTRTGGKRTCMTAAQWAERTARDREDFEDSQRHRTEQPSG